MKKKIAMIQMDVKVSDTEYNYHHAESLLSEAACGHPDIIVMPETWNTGFFPSAELIHYADRDGLRTQSLLSRFAKDHSVNIVGGSVSIAVDDRVYNRSYVFNRQGDLISLYDKVHGFSPAKENNYFTAGSKTARYQLDDIPCSTVTCYDIRFPELVRMTALPDTQMLFVPAQWPTIRLEHWLVLNQARAIENQLFICAVNGCGAVGRVQSAGHSVIYDPWGNSLLEMDGTENIGLVTVDLDTVQDIRSKINVFNDRRTDIYKL